MNRVHVSRDESPTLQTYRENSAAIISEAELSVPLFKVEAIAFEGVDLRVRVSNQQAALACMVRLAFR